MLGHPDPRISAADRALPGIRFSGKGFLGDVLPYGFGLNTRRYLHLMPICVLLTFVCAGMLMRARLRKVASAPFPTIITLDRDEGDTK